MWAHSMLRTACSLKGMRRLSGFALTEQTLVDSFTDKAFCGNPAAVVFEHRSESWMQSVATENNAPVTAFVASHPTSSSMHDIRWYTPTKEITLCGHATLAAAHVIYAANRSLTTPLWFKSEFSGTLGAARTADGYIQMDFPSTPVTPMKLTDAELSNLTTAFGVEKSDILFSGRTVHDVVIEIKRSAFARIPQVLDFRAIADITARGVVVTCIGKKRVGTEKDDYHCVSCGGHSYMNDTAHDYLLRGFYPNIGLNEDFVTGSAQCALAPYYYARLGIPMQRVRLSSSTSNVAATMRRPGESESPSPVFLSGYQASTRGGHMQIALVNCAAEGYDESHRVLIKGKCVTVMKSKILV